MPLVLVVDIGNSYCKIGACQANQVLHREAIITNNRLSVPTISKLLKSKFTKFKFDGAIVGSVVNKHTQTFQKAIQAVFGIPSYLLSKQTKLNFGFDKKIDRSNVGQDLIALAAYCANLSPNAVGFSFGTGSVGIAVVNRQMIGASIIAGLSKNIEILIQKASLIKKEPFDVFANSIVGTDTKTSLESGVYHLRNGFVNSFYNAIQKRFKNKKFISVVSGYESSPIATDFATLVDVNAILLGYYLIYTINNS